MKLTGFDYPKLQLFSSINVLSSDKAITQILSSPDFSGDMIFASITDANWLQITEPVVFHPGNPISLLNQRSNGTIQVQEFSFDNLRVIVNTKSDLPSVLYYADAWYPSWHAYVNGNPTPVIRTNLGYKSVIVPPGESTVVFSFDDLQSEVIIQSIILFGLATFSVILWIFIYDVARQRNSFLKEG